MAFACINMANVAAGTDMSNEFGHKKNFSILMFNG